MILSLLAIIAFAQCAALIGEQRKLLEQADPENIREEEALSRLRKSHRDEVTILEGSSVFAGSYEWLSDLAPPSNPPEDFKFLVLGGSVLDLALYESTNPAFIAHLGAPSDANWIRESQQVGIPYVVSPGHLDAKQAQQWWGAWDLVPASSQQSYSFNYLNVHVVVLDTAPKEPEEVLCWLKLDLMNVDRGQYSWVVVVGYGNWDTSVSTDLQKEFEDVFSAWDVDVTLLGRQALQNSDAAQITVHGEELLVAEHFDSPSVKIRPAVYTEIRKTPDVAGNRIVRDPSYTTRYRQI